MERQNCTFKWQGKSVRLNGKTKLNVLLARQKCTCKWQDKRVRLNGKTKVYV